MSCAASTSNDITVRIFKYIKNVCEATFKESPYVDTVGVNFNKSCATSVNFCGIKVFDCAVKKNNFIFCLKNDYFAMINETDIPVEYEINNIKSLPDFTRIFIRNNFCEFEKAIDYIFTFCEAYVDAHYIPDHTFDCCDLYMQCSDEKHCTCTDYLYSKCCTYKNKLENGIIFFGKNRNV